MRKLGCNARRTLRSLTALAILVSGCAPVDESVPSDDENVGETSDELGTPLPSCSTAGSSGYNAGTKLLALTLGSGVTTVVISASGGKILVNGWQCQSTTSVPLTTSNVSKMTITGTNANEKVIWDNLPGSFGTTLFSATGGVTIDMGSGTDAFMLRGTAAADTYKMGNSVAGDSYFDLTNDNKADIRVIASDSFSISTLGGADNFNASGGAITATNFDATVTTLATVSGAITVYGGDGADTIQGGAGADILYGGPGDDTFKSTVAADGGDTYYGDAGVDLVDYSNRTAAITADIISDKGMARGTKDLTTLTFGASGTIDTDDLVFKVDGGANQTVTFAAPANAAAVVTQINAVAAGVASLSPGNRLVLTSTTTGATSSIIVVSGTGSALTDLGLTAATYDTIDADDGLSGEGDDIQYSVEKINGGSGNDVLRGSDQSNIFNGNAGNDTLYGGWGNTTCASDVDVMNGGDGDDVFDMGAETDCGDALTGGNGTDKADYQNRSAALTITIDATANDGEASEADKVADAEIVLGGSGGDTITGSANADELHGGLGADTLNGGAGNDTLVGGDGADTCNGDAGDDFILESGVDSLYTATVNRGIGDDTTNGGLGMDTVDYSGRSATIDLTLCLDAADNVGAPTSVAAACTDADGEGAEADKTTNVEWVIGGAGDDNFTGTTASETFEGGAGVDTISAGAGDDSIYGDAGDDVLSGGDGDDYIDGGADDDTIDGGLSDGDICVGDADDVAAQVGCEL